MAFNCCSKVIPLKTVKREVARYYVRTACALGDDAYASDG